MSWIVVTLKPNQSKRAEENLLNQGFTTFFPKITYPTNEKSVTKDLFPGYGFIQFTEYEKLLSINSTKGVSKVMRINDSIPQLADSVIEDINKQLSNLNSQFAIQRPFKTNDKVWIKLNILNNQEAEVMNVCNKKDSQKVLLKILNSSQVVWVDGKHLEAKPDFMI
jgi:transcription antitermination factor NusG